MSDGKCSLTRDGIDACGGMDGMLNTDPGSSRGLRLVNVFNFHTTEWKCWGVALHTKEKPKGLIFNFCPWCGVRLIGDDNQPIYVNPQGEATP